MKISTGLEPHVTHLGIHPQVSRIDGLWVNRSYLGGEGVPMPDLHSQELFLIEFQEESSQLSQHTLISAKRPTIVRRDISRSFHDEYKGVDAHWEHMLKEQNAPKDLVFEKIPDAWQFVTEYKAHWWEVEL